MPLIEFDRYFERKFEPAKYLMVEVHVDELNEYKIINETNAIRIKLKQKSIAVQINNELILIEAK